MSDNRVNDKPGHVGDERNDRPAAGPGRHPSEDGGDTAPGEGMGKRLFVDGAAEAMGRNHDLSPPIQWRRTEAPAPALIASLLEPSVVQDFDRARELEYRSA